MLDAFKYVEWYRIDFTGAQLADGSIPAYRVSLLRKVLLNNTAPTPIELDGAPSPFVLSLSNEIDPLTSRYATARISFVDDIRLADLEMTNPRDWQVELRRLSDNKRLFAGYLTTEVYTQPVYEGPNIITINATSPMAVVSATTMPLWDKSLLTFGELLSMVMESSRLIDKVYIPAIYTTEASATVANYADILRWGFSASLYIKVSDTALLDGKEYEYAPYSDVLEAICKLFGWSMVDNGDGALYFISPGYHGEYMCFTAEQLTATESVTPQLITPEISNEGSILPIDNSDYTEICQGASSAVVSVSPAENAALTPKVEQYVKKQNFTRKKTNIALLLGYNSGTGAGTGYGDGYGAEVATISTEVIQSRIKLPRYRLVVEGDRYSFIEDATSQDCGMFYRRMDSASYKAVKPDAENQKTEWSFTSMFAIKDIIVAQRPLTADTAYYWASIPDKSLLMKIASRGGLYLSGAFRIDFSMMATPVEGFYIPTDGALAGGSLVGATYDPLCVPPEVYRLNVYWWSKTVCVSLKVGNKYWNGAAWQDTFDTFDIPISDKEQEWHPIDTNKTIDMPYAGRSGWYCPIEEPLSGAVELCIYSTNRTNIPSNSAYPPIEYMRDLSVEHIPEIEMREEILIDTTYYQDFDSGFTERKEVELPIHSRINGSEQASIIVDTTLAPIDVIYRTTATEADKPERFLLTEYQRLFGRALQRWRRGLAIRQLLPIDLYSRSGYPDNILMLTGYTADFAESTMEVYLSDVKSVKIVRNVK